MLSMCLVIVDGMNEWMDEQIFLDYRLLFGEWSKIEFKKCILEPAAWVQIFTLSLKQVT